MQMVISRAPVGTETASLLVRAQELLARSQDAMVATRDAVARSKVLQTLQAQEQQRIPSGSQTLLTLSMYEEHCSLPRRF